MYCAWRLQWGGAGGAWREHQAPALGICMPRMLLLRWQRQSTPVPQCARQLPRPSSPTATAPTNVAALSIPMPATLAPTHGPEPALHRCLHDRQVVVVPLAASIGLGLAMLGQQRSDARLGEGVAGWLSWGWVHQSLEGRGRDWRGESGGDWRGEGVCGCAEPAGPHHPNLHRSLGLGKVTAPPSSARLGPWEGSSRDMWAIAGVCRLSGKIRKVMA